MDGYEVAKIIMVCDIIYTDNILVYKFQRCRCNTFVYRALIKFSSPQGGGDSKLTKSIWAETLSVLTIYKTPMVELVGQWPLLLNRSLQINPQLQCGFKPCWLLHRSYTYINACT